MIIESVLVNELTSSNPLEIRSYIPLDSIYFESSDLIARPKIAIYMSPMRYQITLEFANSHMIDLNSPYKDLIRYVFQHIILDIDILESDIRYHFPEFII